MSSSSIWRVSLSGSYFLSCCLVLSANQNIAKSHHLNDVLVCPLITAYTNITSITILFPNKMSKRADEAEIHIMG